MAKKIYIDLETTGVDHRIHGIIQIAGIIEIDDKVVKEFDLQCNVNYGVEFDPEALVITGKTIDDISAYDPPEEVYKVFCKIMKEFVNPYDKTDKFAFIGYNASFDMSFLREWFTKNGDKYGIGSWCWFPYIDIMTLAYHFLIEQRPSMENFKLATVADHFGIEMDESELHDALYDIRLARRIYRNLI